MAEHEHDCGYEHEHPHGADGDAGCHCSGSGSELVRFSVTAPDDIVSTMHVHLDHHNCLEILALKGRGERVYELADRLLGLRGVKHGELTCAATKQSLGL